MSDNLDRDIIRRVVRSNSDELEACYPTGLRDQPTLAGRVEVRLEIDARGKVSTSEVARSTLAPADTVVGPCFAKAIESWRFAKPTGGGTGEVVNPFNLSAP